MKKQLVTIGIIILFICVELSGCTSPLDTEKNRFVGTWSGTSGVITYTFTFFSDGTGSMNSFSITWEIKEGKLVIIEESLTLVYSYVFSNNDNTLIIKSSSETITLTKQ